MGAGECRHLCGALVCIVNEPQQCKEYYFTEGGEQRCCSIEGNDVFGSWLLYTGENDSNNEEYSIGYCLAEGRGNVFIFK